MDVGKTSQIFSMIAKAGKSYTFPGVWREVACDKAFFQLPQDHVGLLANLQKKFGNEALLEACVATSSSSAGQLEFSSLLTQQSSLIWAVERPDAGLTVVALVGQMRYMGNKGKALAAAIKCPAKLSTLHSHGPNIIVVYDMVSLALWRSLGFNAIPGADWSQLPAAECRELMSALGISLEIEEEQGRDEPSLANPFEGSRSEFVTPVRRSIILVNGSLAEMTSTDISAAMNSWRFLQDVHQSFPQAFRVCRLWRPSESLPEQVRLLQRIGKAECIAGYLMKSLERDSIPINPKYDEGPTCAEELDRSLRTWQSSIEVASTTDGPRKAFAHLMATHERLQFRSLIDAAANTDDAVERNLLLSLVEVKRMLLPLILHTSHSMLQQIHNSGSRSVDSFASDQFKQVSSFMDQEVKLIKEIQSCRQRKQRQESSAPAASAACTNLPSWAYPRRGNGI